MGANHSAAVRLRNQMRDIRRALADELGRIAATYKSDVEIAKTREMALQKALAEAVARSYLTRRRRSSCTSLRLVPIRIARFMIVFFNATLNWSRSSRRQSQTPA